MVNFCIQLNICTSNSSMKAVHVVMGNCHLQLNLWLSAAINVSVGSKVREASNQFQQLIPIQNWCASLSSISNNSTKVSSILVRRATRSANIRFKHISNVMLDLHVFWHQYILYNQICSNLHFINLILIIF